MTRLSSVLCLAALLALSACPAKTDYGQGCKMTKPKGSSACSIETPREDICGISVTELTDPSFDYIALGSAECDDQVCLRTANDCTVKEDCTSGECVDGKCSDAYADTDGAAVGYCTRGCLDDSDCQPDYQGKKTLVCTQLLFSEAYIAQLKAECDTDENCLYNQIFGSGASTKYCVRPRTH